MIPNKGLEPVVTLKSQQQDTPHSCKMFTFVFFRKMAVKYSDEPKYDWVSLSKKKKGDRAISAFFPLQLTLLSRNTDHHQQSHVFVEWLFLFSLKALILRS